MGFLDKLKIKKKDTSDVAPPPPPAPPRSMQSAPSSTTPPLPQPVGKDAPKSSMPPAPTSVPPMPKMDAPKPAPVPPAEMDAPKLEMPKPAPVPSAPKMDASMPSPSDMDEMPMPEMKKPSTPASREDMRSMSDIPPIKVDAGQKDDPLLTEDHVKDLDVDKFVLPGQAKPQATREMEQSPLKKTSPKPAPAPTLEPKKQGPLFIDVTTYEDVQSSLSDLKGELKEVTKDLETITQLNKQEDEQFSQIVEKLEAVQDRILRIDQDIFEKQ